MRAFCGPDRRGRLAGCVAGVILGYNTANSMPQTAEVMMDSLEPHTGNTLAMPGGHSRLLLAALLGIACLLSVSAQAASNFRFDCDENERFLDEAHPADALTMDAVDLGAAVSAGSPLSTSSTVVTPARDHSGMDRRDDADELDDSLSPLLYLGPRVNSILNNVFETDDGFLDGAVSKPPAGSSPMAETESGEETSAAGGDNVLEIAPAILRIQRQMYRTDI